MGTFVAEPKIWIRVQGISNSLQRDLSIFLGGRGLTVFWNTQVGDGGVMLDIPDAEKVVEWLKAHGVEPRK